MSVQSDSELVQRALNGDRQAYGRLFERHERSVLAVGLAVVGDYHTAQDVAQEAFVRAYRSLGDLRQWASFGSWVCAIARREAIGDRRPGQTTAIDRRGRRHVLGALTRVRQVPSQRAV